MKRAVKFLKQISVIILMFISVQISAQNTVNGNVKDNNNIPLPGANIIIEGTSTGAVTDFDGNFSFTTNQNPPFTLTVSSIGFEPKRITISSLTNPINVVLQEGNTLDEVIVSASRKREKIQEAPAAVSVLTAKKIEAYSSANPIMGLKNLTGVDVAQYGVGDGKVNLRGKSTAFQTETFMIADYRNITIPSFGASVPGQNPVDAIDLDRVEVIKGPGSALYGPGVEAGVVHFLSKSPFKKQGFTFSLGLGNQKQVQSAFRFASVSKNEKLGFKVTGYVRSAEDFKIDDPEGLARIGDDATQIISSVTGENKGVSEIPDYDIRSYGFIGTLEYRMSDKTTIVGTGGYSSAEGLIRVGQGEGYTKLPRPFAQLRVQSGGFFAQAFWSKQLGGDDTWIYGTGLTQYNDISQYEGQVQYNFDVLDEKLDLTVGADYRLNETDSKGSIYGKFEDVDDYSIYGAYLQGKYKATDKLDLIAAGRVDKFEALDVTSFSPRLAAVYKHADNHTFRATYNHSTGAPVALNLFTDLQVGAAVGGTVPVWLTGGTEELTYNNGNAFILGGGLGAVPSELPLAGLYQVVAANFAGSPLEGYINSLLPQITGTTSPTTFGPVLERGPLEASSSDQFEVGYIGRPSDKFKVTLDAYYNKREKNLTATVQSGPLIGYATAGQELHDAIAAVDASGIILPGGATIAQTFQAGLETLTLNPDGSTAIVGFLTADQSPNDVIDVTFFNIESIDYFGADLGLDYFLNDNVTLFGSVSWLSQNYWEEVNILDSEQKVPFSLNVPDLRAKIGIDYLPETGFSANLAARYRSEFESVNGASWTGTTEASTIIDASVGYTFNENYKFNLSASNVFDNEYRPIANAPFIGRTILGKLTIHID